MKIVGTIRPEATQEITAEGEDYFRARERSWKKTRGGKFYLSEK